MAVVLSYGNVPPARGRILLGEQVRDSDWRQIARLNTELWAQAGESLGGLIYDRAALTTTNTTYNIGSRWTLDRWQPVARLTWRHETVDQSKLFIDAYVRNIDIKVYTYNGAWTLLATASAACTNNTPQWISLRQLLTGLVSSDTRIFQVLFRRAAFAADGALYHLGGKMGATLAAEVPT